MNRITRTLSFCSRGIRGRGAGPRDGPWPGTALNAAKGIKNRNALQITIKCLHTYPTVERSSIFIS